MTEPTEQRSRWWRTATRTRARAEVAGLTTVIIACGVVAVDVVPAIADDEKLEGRPVPAAAVPHIVRAALSCPALTPPKVAAQVMAATAFGADGTGSGWAGMDERTWTSWRPSSTAHQADTGDAVLALAHHTCDTVGRLRAAGVEGDLWSAALAADRAGLDAVIKAKGVPAAARDHVDRIEAYQNWYADQPQFAIRELGKTPAPASPEQPVAAPQKLVKSIKAAGRICPTITPVHVAAQLRALSGFDASLRSANGAAGIAQFTDELWSVYQPGSESSRWNPDDAILAMGTAMCDLSSQFVQLSGADPYTMALGAYQWGPQVVRQANGLPRTNVPQLADQVRRHLDTYAKDARLRPAAISPSIAVPPSPAKATTPPASPSGSPSPSRTATPKPSPPATTTSAKPLEIDPEEKYQIRNLWAGAVLELPGTDLKVKSGTRVQLYQNKREKDQFWRIRPAKTDGYVMVLNALTGQALDVEKGSTEDTAKLIVATRNDNASQQWRVGRAADGTVTFENRKSGRVMELLGVDLGPPKADGTWNGYFVQQYEFDPKPHTNRDQHWVLAR